MTQNTQKTANGQSLKNIIMETYSSNTTPGLSCFDCYEYQDKNLILDFLKKTLLHFESFSFYSIKMVKITLQSIIIKYHIIF